MIYWRSLFPILFVLTCVACGGSDGTDDDTPNGAVRETPNQSTVNANSDAPNSGSGDMGSSDSGEGSDAESVSPDSGSQSNGSLDTGGSNYDDMGDGPDDMGKADEIGSARTPRRTDWPRGHEWVRNNETFVSGLVVRFPPVDATFVNDYYDDFNANAAQLWTLGLPDRLNQWLAVPRNDHRWVSWVPEDGVSFANGMVAGGIAPGTMGRIGYQVGDEPRNLTQFQSQLTGVTAIRNYDPDALVYLNMSYSADNLDQMMADICSNDDIDIISHDWYSRAQNQYEKLEYFRDWGLQCDKPYWRYLNSYYDAGAGFELDATDMRWHVLVGLTYGYTGHSWFIYQANTDSEVRSSLFATPGSLTATRTPFYDVAAQLNTELQNYGRVISRLTSTDVRYQTELGALAQPELTEGWQPGAGGDPYLTGFEMSGASFQEGLIGFFEDNYGERYVMVQNPNHSDGSFPVGNDDDATFTLTFDFSSAPAGFDTTVVEHFDGRTATLSDEPLSQNQLVVTLEAGDVYLFKYATGEPWDMQ